jgi:hypothetical protein
MQHSGNGESEGAQDMQDPGFADALLRTNNSTWNVRFAAFQDLQRFCCAEQAMTVLRHVEALVNTFDEHINDAHHRVTQAALLALSAFVEEFGPQLETFLDRLLPKVFLKISDAKESTRNSAVGVLESVRTSYQADALVPVLLKVLAENNPKIRLGCIDFLQYLMEHCGPEVGPYFRSSSHTKQCLVRVASLVADKHPGLRKLAAKTLSQLYRLNANDFLTHLVALPVVEQANTRKSMAAHVPEIDDELAAYTRKGQKNGRQSIGTVRRSDAANRAQSPPPDDGEGEDDGSTKQAWGDSAASTAQPTVLEPAPAPVPGPAPAAAPPPAASAPAHVPAATPLSIEQEPTVVPRRPAAPHSTVARPAQPPEIDAAAPAHRVIGGEPQQDWNNIITPLMVRAY